MFQNTIAKFFGDPNSDTRRTQIKSNRAPVEESRQMILQRIACFERNAVGECLEEYGNFIWALAKIYTETTEEAEETVEKIFLDIWRNAEFFDPARMNEKTFILLIARRRLQIQKRDSTVN